VVEARVHIVDADGVYAEALKEGGVAEADGGVAEGVQFLVGLVAALAAGLAVILLGLEVLRGGRREVLVDSYYHQPLSGDRIHKVLAAHFEGANGERGGGEDPEQQCC
jgi:hypothetical protein